MDGQTIEQIVLEYGEREFMNELYLELKAKRYNPSPVLRTYIPKDNGKKRPLGIPTIKDRVAQMAAKMVIEPFFEADFLDCSFGFRPKRNAHQAIAKIKNASRKCFWVVDVAKKGYFEKRDIKEFDKNNVAYRQKLAKKQKYKCPLCSHSITDGSEGLETHHKIPRVKGGSNEYKNLELVHISCHLEYHKVFPAKGETPNDIQLRSGKKYI